MGGICLKDLKCKPDGYIALTPEVKKFVGLQFPEIYVEGIPNGVDLDLFTPKGQFFSDDDLKEMADIKDPILEHPYVLSTSAFVSFKRLDLLIDAMSKLGEGSLIFTNDGPLKDYIINYGRKKLGKRFIYVGTLDFKKLSILYRTCDLFSLPSDKREGFGNVYIEAMASNLPIVATNDEKRRWIIGEKAGILIDVRNIDVYAEAIKNAYEKDWEKYPRTQAERYSCKDVGERYMKLLQRIVNHNE
jgi:glycosyltransferase involved in cell wall biosynthesis